MEAHYHAWLRSGRIFSIVARPFADRTTAHRWATKQRPNKADRLVLDPPDRYRLFWGIIGANEKNISSDSHVSREGLRGGVSRRPVQRTLAYYRCTEDQARGDPKEGIYEFGKDWKITLRVRGYAHSLSWDAGDRMKLQHDRANILCTTASYLDTEWVVPDDRYEEVLDRYMRIPEEVKKFGDFAVIVHQWPKFLAAYSAAKKAGLGFDYDLVDYSGRPPHLTTKHFIFCKSNEYMHEREFRLAFFFSAEGGMSADFGDRRFERHRQLGPNAGYQRHVHDYDRTRPGQGDAGSLVVEGRPIGPSGAGCPGCRRSRSCAARSCAQAFRTANLPCQLRYPRCPEFSHTAPGPAGGSRHGWSRTTPQRSQPSRAPSPSTCKRRAGERSVAYGAVPQP